MGDGRWEMVEGARGLLLSRGWSSAMGPLAPLN